MPPSKNENLHIFVSYSHRDARHLEQLKIHLAPYIEEGDLESWLWDDTQIQAGSKWFNDIQQALQRADAAILLLSTDFLASRFIVENELPFLLDAAEKKGIKIIPVILNPCGFEDHKELSQFQTAHKASQPFSSIRGKHKREVWWEQVAKNIYEATVKQKIQQSSYSVEHAKIAYQRGLQHLHAKSYLEAIDQFKIALNSPSYEVLYSLGETYREYGLSLKEQNEPLSLINIRNAAEHFEKSTIYKPEALAAYIQSGLCFEEIADYPQAANKYKQAQQLNVQDPAIYYRLGMIATKQGKLRDAEIQFLNGLKVDPTNVSILIALGQLYATINILPSAISAFRQATQHHPEYWNAWYELGRAYIKNKSWSLALQALEKALVINTDESTIYSAMALCYKNTGNNVEAERMAIEAQKYDPQNTEVKHLLQ